MDSRCERGPRQWHLASQFWRSRGPLIFQGSQRWVSPTHRHANIAKRVPPVVALWGVLARVVVVGLIAVGQVSTLVFVAAKCSISMYNPYA